MVQRWAGVLLVLALALSFSVPVYAHTTLGDLNGSAPYFRSNDHELNPTNTFGNAHVPGPLGYVWPGSGLDIYSGNPSNPPGYQSPFSDFEEPPQEAANSYSPEGAILTSTSDHDSVGDLIFAINFSQPHAYPNPLDFKYTTLALYIPAPVFDPTGARVQDGFEPAAGVNWDGGENTNIVTTITDNYGNIFVTRADSNDPFEPGSWIVYITAPNNITFTKARGWNEWYYVRINQMKAPMVAGRYFFKMFLDNHFALHSQSNLPQLINSTMPMENWPVLLVKGEVDPAIISGRIRYGDIANPNLYGLPLNLPGRIRAVGVAIDPITGAPTNRPVEARGYFNATAHGHFEIEGVAPGIYSLYASAAGFPEQLVASNVKLARGQSLSFDAYLQVGPQIRGTVYSKVCGPPDWPGQLPITIVIYNSNTYDAASIVTYSPSNLTHAPFTSYVVGNTEFSGDRLSASNTPRSVAFPWEGPIGYNALTVTPTFKDPFGLFNGVGPAQPWWVDPLGNKNSVTSLGSSSSDFDFQFGVEGVFGAPAKFSGMVPQIFATWTDSLQPGQYYVRAFVNGYVQTTIDGTHLVDYSFQVSQNGLSNNVFVPIDLERSSSINVTVHFHDLAGTIVDAPIRGPDPRRFLIAEAYSSDGTLSALNFTQVTSDSSQASILLNGFGMIGPILPPDPRAFIKYSLARYRGIYDYGLPTDTYTIRLYMRGYIQALPPASGFEDVDQPITASISTCGTISVSGHMYRGGEINATVFSVDWERPAIGRNWVWNSSPVSVLVYDVTSKAFVDSIYFWNSKLNQWMVPAQNSEFNNLPWPGWQTTFGSGASFLVTNGSTFVDRFGPDIPSLASADPAQDEATIIFLEENFHAGFLYGSTFYRSSTFRSALAIYPGVYALNAWTYGYVQDNVASLGDLGNDLVSVSWLASEANAQIQLILGVNLTISMVFKTENILTGIPFNSSFRIRVFDEGDNLIAATTVFSDAGVLVPSSNAGFFADGRKLLQRPIPAGTRNLQYSDLAGLFSYNEPSTGVTGVGGVSAAVRTATLFSSDHGIWGYSDHPGAYAGRWTVMVDVVNWSTLDSNYPPVPGLLQGESPYFYPYNHLGPYTQTTFPEISNAAQGGEASVIFELDLKGFVSGLVLGLNWDNGVRTMSWASVTFAGEGTSLYWYTWDGLYEGYLNPGRYNVTITEWTNANQGHVSQSIDLTVNTGQRSKANDVILEESGIPIPETSTYTTLLLTALTVTLVVVYFGKQRSNRKTRLRNLHCTLG